MINASFRVLEVNLLSERVSPKPPHVIYYVEEDDTYYVWDTPLNSWKNFNSGIQSLQDVVNVSNGISNYGGIGNASIQSTNFVNNRTLYLNNDAQPTVAIVDNLNSANNLTIDLNTLTLDNVSYNWADIVNQGTVTSVTATTPLSSTGGVTPNISIQQASASQDGYLSSTDWSTFNTKQDSIAAGTIGQYWRGDKTWQTLNTTAVAEGTSLYFTEARTIASILTGLNVIGGTVTSTDSILSAFGKLQNQLNAVASPMIYQGTWNASTNFPVLTSSTGTKGYVYRVTTSGSTNIDGITDWKSGDFIVYNGSTWDKWDSTDAVTSVNGYTGVVTLVKADVGLSNVENTALSTWAGSTNITTVGTIGSGTWQGTAIADTYISSAATWNAKVGGSGTTNYLSKFTAAGTIGDSVVFETAGNVGIGTITPSASLHVNNIGTGNSFLVEDVTNPDATPFVIDANGNVGIGVTTPNASLEVNSVGATTATYIARFSGAGTQRFNFTSDGIQYWGLNADPTSANGFLSWDIGKAIVGAAGVTNNLSFVTGTSTRMHILASGNVGIGTTTPNAKLDVSGSINIYSGVDNTSTRPAISATTLTNGEIRAYSSLGNTWDDGFLRISAGGGTNATAKSYIDITGYSNVADMNRVVVIGTAGGERMRINNIGDVGIGTTTPTSKLHINNIGTGNSFLVEDDTNVDASPFVIDTNGNVGMGTLTPASVLHVKANPSSTSTATIRLESDAVTANSSIGHYSGGIHRWEVGTGINLAAQYEIFDRVAGQTRFSISSGGATVFSNGDVTISTIANATTDTDKFLVSDSGVIKYRTGAEILSDVGAQGSITLTTTGTSGAATLVGNTLNIPQYLGGVGTGTVTSVGLSMPSAFTVSNSPITSSGTIAVTGSGTTSDYIRGDGTLATFPTALPTANVKHSVKYGVALTKGQAVYVSSADGTNMVVSKADNSAEATSSKTMGLVTTTGAANYQGEVITEGLLAGLNTSTATVGDAVWLGTNGNLIFWHYGLTTKPVAPAHLVFIGIVTRVNANNGEIFVKPQNGFEIDELHDVSVVGRANNTLLGYNSATSLHEFKTVPTWLGYTPVAGSGTTNYLSKFTATGTIGDSAVFETAGNVGIGTITPSASLHVNNIGTGNSFLVEDVTNPDATPFLIDSDGNVAVGSSSAYSSSKLDIYAGNTARVPLSLRRADSAADHMVFVKEDTNTQWWIALSSDDFRLYNSTATDNILFGVNGGSADTGNKVGIGTATPSAKLDVNGDVKISTIANAIIDTDKFLVSDSGVIKYRTGAELLSDIGMSNVNNTSDLNKPISTATQTALNLIADVNWLGDYNNGYTYSVGDGVMFNGASFRMYNYIGAAGYTPSAYPGNWKQITDYVSPNDIGLGNVDNTSDLNKPISTATQTALNLKMDTNSSIDAHNDVTITSPIVNQILQWNGSQWINASGSVVNAGPGVVYFLTDITAGFGTYEYMSKTPDGLAEIQETVIVNNNTVLIHEYISDVAVNKTTIDAGIWEFNLFGYVDTLNANFVVDVYKRTTGGTETLLFSAETELISWTAVDLSSVTTVQQQFTCDATDKLVVKVSGKTTQTSNVTLKLAHSGTTHYSHIHTPLTVVHNDIAGLQGGATGEYFHLNSAANTKLLSWQSSGIPNADIQSASTWNSKIGGSGSANFISKFTASGTIGNSLIQDDGTGLSIGIASPYPGVRFYIASTGIAIVGSGNTYGVQGKGGQYGVWGESASDEAGNHIGVYGSAGDIDGGGATYIGGRFVGGGANGANYSLWLQDNTQGVGKFLKSITSDGKANWATLTVADTGLALTTTGSSGAATLVGNTLNIPQYTGSSFFIPNFKADETYRGISLNNNSTTVVSEGGVVMSSSASTLAQSVSSTNFATKQIRLRYYASVVSGGRYTGTRGSALLWYIHGGFRFVCDFNISDTSYSAGCQQFYGMSGVTADLNYGSSSNILVSTLLNIVGVGSEVGDANLQIFHNDGSGTATKVDLGVGFPANRTAGAISTTVYSIQLYNAPMSTDVKYEVINKETGGIAQGTVSTNLPLTSQGLNFFASRCMSVTSVTNTGQFDLMKLGVYSI